MKKLYTLLTASVVAVSAIGANASPVPVVYPAHQSKINKNQEKIELAQGMMAPANLSVMSLRKADGNLESVEGFYTLLLGDFYMGDSANDYIECEFEAIVRGTTVKFEPLDNIVNEEYTKLYPMTGELDPETNNITFGKLFYGTMSVKNQETGETIENALVYQQPYSFNVETEKPENVESITATYDAESGIWEFGIDEGLAWTVYLTEEDVENDDEPYGSIAMFDIVTLFKFRTTPYLDGDWTDIGEATLADPWLVPALRINQMSNAYKVKMQQSNENKFVYRLVDPYLSGPVAQQNKSTKGGYIVFDMSDFDHVVLLPADAGFENLSLVPGGIKAFYCYNRLGAYAVQHPIYPLETIIDMVKDNIPYTTYKNGRVTFGSIKFNGQDSYDANFGIQSNPFGGMSFGRDMNGYIQFPEGYNAGVEALGEELDETVEFFNLQGVRVANPAAGQIVIKRTGNKIKKIVVR